MLFHSKEFLLYFFPLTFTIYFLLQKYTPQKISKIWLTLAGFFFYGWWKPIYLTLLLASIGFNYVFVQLLLGQQKGSLKRKQIFVFSIIFNLGLLGYFKYFDFFISNLNWLGSFDLPLQHIILPLGISFFTFQKIALLADVYTGEQKQIDFLDYCLFVNFFPQLIAGPIVHHKEMMPQFDRGAAVNAPDIYKGLYLFAIGFIKKNGIADTFGMWANSGFGNSEHLRFFEGWAASLSYTIQLYFDFSGYSDMAIGLALFFAIKLPQNFNSPYKALNIQDFWRRWHMTLGRFLSQYIYIPLGGNRHGLKLTCRNALITFFIAGLWHGANWTFVIWGVAHGLAIVIYNVWKTKSIRLPSVIAWFITFMFVNFAWVMFRAIDLKQAVHVYRAMLGLNGIVLDATLERFLSPLKQYGVVFGNWFSYVGALDRKFIFLTIIVLSIALFRSNSNQLVKSFKFDWKGALLMAFAIVLVINLLIAGNTQQQFLYFNF